MLTRIRQVPRRIAGLYALFGLAWILFSDRGLAAFGLDHRTEVAIQTWKGSVFVLVSAGLIYTLLRVAMGMVERKAKALAQSEERHRHLFDDSPHPTWCLDLGSLNYVTANQAAVKCLGYDVAELRRLSPSELLVEEDRPRYWEVIGRIRREGGGACGRWRVYAKSGAVVFLDVVSSSIEIDDVRCLLIQAKDVTAEVAAESTLVGMSEQLASISAEVNGIGQAAAHQLQQPLRQVVSHLQLLARRCDHLNDEARDYLGFAIDGALRMKATLDDIVQLTGMASDPPEFTNLSRVVDEVVELLRPRLLTVGGQVEVRPLPVLRVRERHLRLLLAHLLDNAIKFRDPDRPPLIRISAEPAGGVWHFHVADNGIGIPPEHHLDIFGIFRRLDEAHSLPGNGIGLAVCKKIVESHGGRIGVTSTVGQGSTFSFTLPVPGSLATP